VGRLAYAEKDLKATLKGLAHLAALEEEVRTNLRVIESLAERVRRDLQKHQSQAEHLRAQANLSQKGCLELLEDASVHLAEDPLLFAELVEITDKLRGIEISDPPGVAGMKKVSRLLEDLGAGLAALSRSPRPDPSEHTPLLRAYSKLKGEGVSRLASLEAKLSKHFDQTPTPGY